MSERVGNPTGVDPTPSDGTPAIQASAVTVAIGGRPVLRGIDLRVPRGQFLALMGANGSGKSTLVRALTGLWPLTSGEVRLFGEPLADFGQWARVGFLPQRAGAAGGVPASVREVVSSGRLTSRRLFRPLGREDRRAVDDAIEVVGLTEYADHGVSHLSGGQQQRVLIARALAGGGDLFILDEPTAGVDLPNQEALANTLRVMAGRGATVVLVAHELGPMASLVDRAVVMRDGRIAYDGPRLDDHAVHQPDFGDHPHAHHHPAPDGLDHAPRVTSPFDLPGSAS
jgi:zinc transport system ATP-binding protein